MEDFVRGLRDIHRQFEWPMPVLSSAALNQLKKSRAGESCLANISLHFFLKSAGNMSIIETYKTLTD